MAEYLYDQIKFAIDQHFDAVHGDGVVWPDELMQTIREHLEEIARQRIKQNLPDTVDGVFVQDEAFKAVDSAFRTAEAECRQMGFSPYLYAGWDAVLERNLRAVVRAESQRAMALLREARQYVVHRANDGFDPIQARDAEAFLQTLDAALVPPTGRVNLSEQPNTDPQPTSATPPSPPAVVDYTERADAVANELVKAGLIPDQGGLFIPIRAKIAAGIAAVASEHQAEIEDLYADLVERDAEIASLRHDNARYQAIASSEAAGHSEALAKLARLGEPEIVEAAARALWDSEPVIYEWGPQERHRIPWEEAVTRDLAGVRIFRQFANAALAVITEKLADAP